MWEALLKIAVNLSVGIVIIAVLDNIRIREFGDNFVVALLIALINTALVPVMNMLGFPLPVLLAALCILVLDVVVLRYIHMAVAGFSVQGMRCSLVFAFSMAATNTLLFFLI
ncbi:MAG: phage holin family protein [Cyclobacteriaceae bacterium]